MKKLVYYIAFILCGVIAQAQDKNPETFINNISKHCGKAYVGKIVSNPIPADFEGKELIMYVMSCGANEVKIPFFVGDDLSRTWVFTLEDDRIKLKHDHRQQNGEPDEITMYGGTTTNTGLTDKQFFPADQETSELMPSISGNMWWVSIDNDEFSYNLKRVDSEGSFRVVFDLKQPVETTKRPWAK